VSAWEILSLDAAVIGSLMLALWLVSLKLRDASIVDPFWGTGFVIVGWTAALAGELSGWGLVLALLTTAWGLRLSIHLARRNLGHGEDFRYRAMRKRYPRFELTSLVIVFGLQGLLLWIVALPLQLAPAFDGSSHLLGAAGVAVWAVGLVFEAVGDAQLARFRADPANRGRTLDRGLWRYTRHPNYFGDVLVWWGFFCFALAAPFGAVTALSPVLLTFLVLRVSGVPLLERGLRKRRDDYAAYCQRTSAFIPRPPRGA
jgi:steroid 5-alpha reductase family enzyme